MKRRVITQHETRQCDCIKCSQLDNIQRDGYMDTETQYNRFVQAGINYIEQIRKMYPQRKLTLEQEEQIQYNSNFKHKEDLDIQDAIRTTDNFIKEDKKELEKLTKERENIIKKAEEQNKQQQQQQQQQKQ